MWSLTSCAHLVFITDRPAFEGHAKQAAAASVQNLDAHVLAPALVAEPMAAVHPGGILYCHITQACGASNLATWTTRHGAREGSHTYDMRGILVLPALMHP
jgi:hypothetical protein